MHVRRVELAEVLQRRHQARDADGKAGRRHRLAAEARDQPVIAPAAADRAEADDLALLVGDFGQQFGLVDRAGVIFEAADDGGIDRMRSGAIACRLDERSDARSSSLTPVDAVDRLASSAVRQTD